MAPGDRLFRKMLGLSGALHAVTFVLGVAWFSFSAPSVRIAPFAVVDLVSGGQFASQPAEAARESPPAEVRRQAPAAKARVSTPPAGKREKAAAKAPPAREDSHADAWAFSERIGRMREEKAKRIKVREAVEAIQREKEVRAALKGIGDRVAHRVDLSAIPPPAKRAAPPGARGGMTGSPGVARVPPEILAYARALDEKVRANWTVPELAQKDLGGLIAQVRITIEKDGRVSNVRMEKVSGNPYFDDSVRRAIRKASPLPVPPDQLRGGEDHYDVGFRFFGGGGNL
jgi:TonB family protein